MLLLNKIAKLKVENSAQTAFRFSPIRYNAPSPIITLGLGKIESTRKDNKLGEGERKVRLGQDRLPIKSGNERKLYTLF
jgi:hypothetical protein